MIEGWSKMKFKDAVDFQPTVKLNKGELYPFIAMEDIEPGVRFVSASDNKKYDGSSCTKFRDGDILFARITPCLQNGKIAQARIDGKGVGFGSTEYFVFRAKPGIVDQRFLYYYVTSESFSGSAINSMVGASGRQRADKGYVNNLDIVIPPLPIQSRIADILSAYDELIDVNNRRIAILEQMAEQIYKEWFVRMRFPGYEKAKFVKGIPEDWEEIKFKQFVTLKRGYDLPNQDMKDGAIPVVASTSVKGFHNQHKVAPPVIVTGRSGSLGHVQFIEQSCWPLNTTLYSKDLKGNSPWIVYYTLVSMHLENYNSGAGVPTLNRNHLASLPISRPPKKLQEEFERAIQPMRNEIQLLRVKNGNLNKQKQLLLPRLVSGKIQLNIHEELPV